MLLEKNGANHLACVRVAIKLRFVKKNKKTVSAKYSKASHNKTRCVCLANIFFLSMGCLFTVQMMTLMEKDLILI